MGYVAPIGAIDVSNSNTPLAFDPTNPDGGSYYRVVAQIDQHGKLRFTETNAYSGNNGRAAILNNSAGANLFYRAWQRGERCKSPTGVNCYRRRSADPHAASKGFGRAESWASDAGCGFQYYSTWLRARQDWEVRQFPRPKDI